MMKCLTFFIPPPPISLHDLNSQVVVSYLNMHLLHMSFRNVWKSVQSDQSLRKK